MNEYTLEIFPDEPRPALGLVHDEVRLVFKDVDTKSVYIKKESLFTHKEFINYLINATKEAQRELDLKRVLFARQQNYAPVEGDKFTWEYNPSDGGDEPKLYA